MACHRRRWSSEPSSAQILYQICKLLQFLLHLLPLAVVMRTYVVALNEGHGAKDTRMAIELRLVIHGDNRRHQCSRDKHTFAHRRQMGEFAIIEGQLGIAKLVTCRRASNRIFVDVLCTWVFSIGRCPHSCRSQVDVPGGVYL